jgi:hypothetical protein
MAFGSRRAHLVLRGLVSVVAATSSVAAADAPPRIALVIGNADYESVPLANPANDARLIADALVSAGFDVGLHTNLDQKETKRAIREFGDRLERERAIGVFYYAGHGVQVNGENFLIPVGAHIEREAHLAIEAVSADELMHLLAYARNPLNVVILDACRHNPYSRTFRGTAGGLARMATPSDTLLAYATGPGAVAMDGDGAHSPYAEALAAAMSVPDEPVEQTFKRVRRAVVERTGGEQVPWETSSLTRHFAFRASNSAAPDAGGKAEPGLLRVAESAPPSTDLPEAAPRSGSTPTSESALWQAIQASDIAADYWTFLGRHPDGSFAELAHNRLRVLDPTYYDGRYAYEGEIEGSPCGEDDYSFSGEVHVEDGRFEHWVEEGPFSVRLHGHFEGTTLTVGSTASRSFETKDGELSSNELTEDDAAASPDAWMEVAFRAPRKPVCNDFGNQIRYRRIETTPR